MYRLKGLTNYCFGTCTSMIIDAGPMGNHTRFINHSCRENCVPKVFSANEVTIVTVRDVKQGEELLLHYGKGYFKHLTCLCGEDNCLENEKQMQNKEA